MNPAPGLRGGRAKGAPERAPTDATFFNRSYTQHLVGIHIIGKTGVKEYTRKPVGKETYIEDFLEKHVAVLDPGIFVIGRQVRTDGNNSIDLMGMDGEGNTIIIELKRGMPARQVISQALDYAVWAENADYDELNSIAKKNHLGKYEDLHGLFRSKFNTVPEPWNADQKIYIVAERIDEKTGDMASYLRRREVDIYCVEFNFYENAGQEIVNVDFVVGDLADTSGKNDRKDVQIWEDILNNTTDDNHSMVSTLISTVEKMEPKPLAGPQSRYYYMRVSGKDKKNLFGAIVCQKKSAYVSFRVDPDTFGHDDNPEIRSDYRWFFTKETERRIPLTKPNLELILQCLKHAHDATSML